MQHGGAGAGLSGRTRRSLAHLGLSIPAVAVLWWLPSPYGSIVLVLSAVLALLTDLLRLHNPRVARLFAGLVGEMFRPEEELRLCRATTLAAGFALVAVLFPVQPAVAGMLYAGMADPAASLVGRRFGRSRYGNGKSLSGAAAFAVVALGIGICLPFISFLQACLLALGLAALEVAWGRWDDNLLLPLAGAAGVWFLSGFG